MKKIIIICISIILLTACNTKNECVKTGGDFSEKAKTCLKTTTPEENKEIEDVVLNSNGDKVLKLIGGAKLIDRLNKGDILYISKGYFGYSCVIKDIKSNGEIIIRDAMLDEVMQLGNINIDIDTSRGDFKTKQQVLLPPGATIIDDDYIKKEIKEISKIKATKTNIKLTINQIINEFRDNYNDAIKKYEGNNDEYIEIKGQISSIDLREKGIFNTNFSFRKDQNNPIVDIEIHDYQDEIEDDYRRIQKLKEGDVVTVKCKFNNSFRGYKISFNNCILLENK